MTGDLVERLRSALLAAAHLAREATAGPWAHDRGVIEAPEKAREVRLQGGITSVDRWYVVLDSSTGQAVGDEDGAFIAANDPAHVLRTIQAHRALVDLHNPDYAWSSTKGAICNVCVEGVGMHVAWPCKTLRLIAAIYLPDIEP